MSVIDQVDAPPPAGRPRNASEVPKKSIWQFELTKKRVPRKELMHFSRQLAVFIKAGIPILDALEVINEEMGNKAFRAVLVDVVENLRAGQTFAQALSGHPEAFPTFYLGILGSAELTGHLDEVLIQLSGYLDRDLVARGKIKSAMTYPAVIMAMSVVVVVILVSFVLPRFEVFFRDLHAKLPLPTRLLLSLSGFLTDNVVYIVGGILFVLLGLVTFLRTQRGRAARDALLLKLPVVGDLITHVILERFCRIMSSMMSAGVPLPDALEVTTAATNNAVYVRGLGRAREAMMRGEGLSTPLAETGLFPASARQMFRVGENTGTLDAQLDTAATYFERELDYKITRFTNLFEPAVLMFVGLVVGFVAIALVSAMYGIFNQANTVN
jgi:type IV pilus assembly protein PilC